MQDVDESFYHRMRAFQDFRRIAEDQVYLPFPSGWWLILTDIPGSTKAIESGLYKQVNVLGATSIIAALNACKGLDVPFVFGGDGATLAVPSRLKDSVIEALRMTRWVAKYRFDLDLRIGAFPAEKVKVAKFQLSPKIHLAMLSGDGLRAAEGELKDPSHQEVFYHQYSPIEPITDTFHGLECRWNPLKPKGGVAMSLIVQAKSVDTYQDLIEHIETALGFVTARPVSTQSVEFKWPPKGIWDEIRVQTAHLSLWQQLIYALRALSVALLGVFLFRTQRPAGAFDPKAYFQELMANSDYRKFDNTLRMVLDVTPRQAEELKNHLDARRKRGELVYGIHLADEALMTCMVFSWDKHVHFIDGGGGGYAVAAKQLKEQLKEQGGRI